MTKFGKLSVFICFILLGFVGWYIGWYICNSKHISSLFIQWEESAVYGKFVEAGHIYSQVSLNRKYIATVRGQDGLLFVYSPSCHFKHLISLFNTVPIPGDSVGAPFIWNFFWVGDLLVMVTVAGLEAKEIKKLDRRWSQYKDSGEIVIINPNYPPHHPMREQVMLRNVSLYWGFVPGPDGRTLAVIKERIGELRKGVLYEIPTGKILREVKWKGRAIGGYFANTSNLRNRFLGWDKDGKRAWVIEREIIKSPFGPGSGDVGCPILVSLDFEGNRVEVNGKNKGEWLFSTVYTILPSNQCAVVITKNLAVCSAVNWWDKVYIAHYSQFTKVLEISIPSRLLTYFNKANMSLLAITPDGKALVLKDKYNNVFLWKSNYKKPKFMTKAQIVEAVDWLDENHLLVIAGNEEQKSLGILEIKE